MCVLTVVKGNDVEAVQELSLVLVNALNLTVKHALGVDFNAIFLLQMLGKLVFVFL